MGGKALKWSSPSQRSVPDRICLFSGGRVELVECKATGRAPTRAQAVYFERLRQMGFPVVIVDSRASVDAWEVEVKLRVEGLKGD